MAKRIQRGNPLTELVKGSYEYTRHTIVRAFHKAFPSNWDYDNGEWFNVEDTFDEFIVVSSSKLPIDEFYMVTYQRDGTAVTFALREDWEVIELGYSLPGSQGGGGETIQMSERQKRGSKITETYASAVRLVEAKGKKKPGVPRVEAKLAEADVVNRNGRRYRRIVLRDAVEEARSHLHESFSQARAILTGEDSHPGDKFQRPMLREVVVVWDDVWFDESDGWVYIAGNIVETAVGKDVLTVLRAGVMPPISLRAYGESEQVKEGDESIDEVIWLRLTGADLVLEPGFEGAGVTEFQESANGGTTNEMDIEQLKQQLAEAQKELKAMREAKDKSAVDAAEARIKELQEAVKTAEAAAKEAADKAAKLEEAEAKRQKELAEAREKEQADAAAAEKALRERLGIGPDDNLAEALAAEQKKLDEAAAKELAAEAATYVESAVGDLPYPALYKDRVKAYIGEAATVEIAKTKLEEAKDLFAPLVAKERLAGMGMGGNNGRVQHIVPVLEAEANVPEFARAAFEITESMIAHNYWQPRQNRSQTSRAARFTKLYLEAYDRQFERQLAQEAHDWQEAMTTSQLNTPYSVLRAIVDEAFPQLVALSIFDVATVDSNPARIFYEAQYEAESGTNATSTDETVTAVDDTWVDMDFKRVDPSSIVARSASSGGGTLYTYGTDYVIDHTNGRFMNFADGAIANGATVYLSYTYKAIRKGEGVGIQRARSKVAFIDLSLEADRLATEVSDEAIKFSRSQLGYDAVGRTINLLMKEIMRRIDGNLMHDALSRVLTVTNNSGGTWASATDSEKEFLKKAGTARVKVENRFYTPEIMLLSKTNSDLISNADFFTAAGSRPDAALDEAGYVGRMKGLDVYASPVFTDAYSLIHNRELLMYRTFGAMELKGPYPTYDSNRLLVANEQYFIQEYNGYISPIPGKGSYVKIS